ncbi:MAG: c-type cytochrome [Chloroflexi bacterium]|nr:c-type cytochrome [Chloroflexota bacterium]
MSTQLKILVGMIFTLLTCVPLAVIAVNDLGHDIGVVPSTQETGMDARAADLTGRQIEVGADLFGQYCYSCHGTHGEGIPQLAPTINRKDLLDGRREKSVGWSGSVEGFIKDTISAGRPIQSRPDLYSAHMPTWSQEYGGPLRPDQIDSLVAFVMNWQDQAPEVNAWPPPGTPQPTATPGPSPTPAPLKAGINATCQNVPAEYAGLKPPYALTDPGAISAGKQTYDDKCAACHGPQGKGDGPAAAALNPKPANFTDKAFMQGIPVDCQFYRISEGVTGTGMPPWKALGQDTIWKVLIYERSLSGVQ